MPAPRHAATHPITLAGLLANKKAVAPLLGFLKTTKVGEREVEWERRNDRAGKDLLE